MSSTTFALPTSSLNLDHTEAMTRTAAALRSRLMSFDSLHSAPARHALPLGLADIRQQAAGVRLLAAPVWSSPRQRFLVRPELASRLHIASRLLPGGYDLGFWEGYRPLTVQRTLWETGLSLLNESFPGHAAFELEAVLETYVARPNPGAPHSLGSAVDIALVNRAGRVLDGSDDASLAGQRLLAEVLTEAGLSNYAPEWWHWSYDGVEVDYLQ